MAVAAVLISAGALYAAGGQHTKVKQTLTATSVAPAARGKARLLVKSSKDGRFAVVATHLARNATYALLVGGVKVGAIQTTGGGSGRASFRTVPRAKDALLGFDPRGTQVIVRDEDDGEDVLVADIPADDPAAVACCLSEGGDEGEVECEDLSSDECVAAGGTVQAVDSCLPNPCATTPGENEELVCCTNETHDDENEAECEDVATSAECAAMGGIIVEATSCDSNPCGAAPPADRAACCVPDDDGGGEIDCEVLSPETCAAQGGTGVGSGTAAATCSGDPCGGGDDDGGGGDD